MRVFFFNEYITVFIFFVLWFSFQAMIAFVCTKLPDKVFCHDNFLFRTRRWEKGGEFYQRVFKIRKWKGRLPDGAALFKNGYRKKHFNEHTQQGYNKYVIESCRAELIHLASIFPFWIFGFFADWYIIPIMFAYAVIVNLPCVIAQRYNRPRFVRLMLASAKPAQNI